MNVIDVASHYRYQRLTSDVLGQDMDFSDKAPSPGQRLPEFKLQTLDGEMRSDTDLIGSKPVLLIPVSVTCPMTASSMPLLKRLSEEFGNRIRIVLLYVREAHPGEHFPQPRSMSEKVEHARALREREKIEWTILVDDLEGAVHSALDEKPNSAYVIDATGTIVFRSLWAGDVKSLHTALTQAVQGKRPEAPESRRRLGPMAAGIGKMRETLHGAGSQAERDLWRAAPPLAAVAWTAGVFRPLGPKWRTAAAAGVLGIGAGLIVRSLARQLRGH